MLPSQSSPVCISREALNVLIPPGSLLRKDWHLSETLLLSGTVATHSFLYFIINGEQSFNLALSPREWSHPPQMWHSSRRVGVSCEPLRVVHQFQNPSNAIQFCTTTSGKGLSQDLFFFFFAKTSEVFSGPPDGHLLDVVCWIQGREYILKSKCIIKCEYKSEKGGVPFKSAPCYDTLKYNAVQSIGFRSHLISK